MTFFTELWSQEFMRRAMLGAALIGFTNGMLGSFIILRRMSLMADALSHSMLPGLALGMLWFGLQNPAGLFVGGLTAAALVAVAAALFSRGSRLKEDTTLAILYTFAFSIGVIILSKYPQQVDLKHYLFGDVLGMDNADLWTSYGVALVVIPTIVLFLRPLLLTIFDSDVARSQGVPVERCQFLIILACVLSLVSSARALGVILMLGLLVTPAAIMNLLTDNFTRMMWGGGIIGVVGSLVGLILSYRFDSIPSGAMIVLVLFIFFLAAWFFSPRYGLFARMRKSRHFHEESLKRWGQRAEPPH